MLELDKMKNEDFLEFGNSSLAFVKKENHENDSGHKKEKKKQI